MSNRKMVYKILVAEGSAINQKLIVRCLQRLGYNVEAVSNGQEAVSAIEHRYYDLMLMDVQMPVMDDLTATRLIRQMKGSVGDTPIVGVTAQHRAECLAAGMNDHLYKPLKSSELQRVLQCWLTSTSYAECLTACLTVESDRVA